jgi:hypothetical protein
MVHRVQRTLEAALQHILEYDLTYGINTVTCAYDGDRFWGEQRCKVMLTHDVE